MEEPIPIFNTFIQEYLRQVIINQPYIFVDYWSAVHFCSGSILGLLMSRYYSRRHAWLVALLLLIAYEIFEIYLTGILFIAETMVDKIWDLIIGMIAYFIFHYLFRKRV